MAKDEAHKLAIKKVEEAIEILYEMPWQVIKKLPEQMADDIAVASSLLSHVLSDYEAEETAS